MLQYYGLYMTMVLSAFVGLFGLVLSIHLLVGTRAERAKELGEKRERFKELFGFYPDSSDAESCRRVHNRIAHFQRASIAAGSSNALYRKGCRQQLEEVRALARRFGYRIIKPRNPALRELEVA